MLMKSALWSTDAQNRIALNIWIALGILAVISYVLIMRDDYLGTAMALVIGESSFFAMNLYGVRKKKLPMGKHLWKPIMGGVGMIAAAFTLDFVTDGNITTLNISVIAFLAYLLIILGLGFFTRSDKVLFRDVLSRRKH